MNTRRILPIVIIVVALAGFLASCSSDNGKKTSFAIVIDSMTYENCQQAVDSYRSMLESEGLHTYLLANDWQHPDEIRSELKGLYAANPPLEGAVFIGDIPIPMIRDAQHLTSAFKMDQIRFPFHRSSVPSDRFYDDFHLEFEYLRQDEDNPLYHYYSLKPESAQKIQTSIYSGRIKAPVNGKDKYQQISHYLDKVVEARQEINPLNHAITFSGHGYNSECLVAWASEKITLREQLPGLFRPGASMKYLFFNMEEFSKFQLLSELQRPELDMALLSHHGAPSVQYLDGYPNVSAITPSIQNIRRFLRSKLTTASQRGQNLEETMQYYIRTHGVPRAWFDDTFDPKVVLEDSIFNANVDIHLSDLDAITPNARFVKFDACFNGSFHLDQYVAGSYIFGPGRTIVTMGNSVNVLQDNWPTEMVGLLGEGVRIGNWARHIHFLENHIIGDPTFYFHSENKTDWNNKIVRKKKDVKFWMRQLNNPNPDIQALALVMLYNNQLEGLPDVLLETFKTSEFGSVRMQSLNLLRQYNNSNFIEALKLAVSDPVEIIRRQAVRMIGEVGSDELLPALVYSKIHDRHSKRVLFNARNSFAFMNAATAREEMSEQATSSHLFHRASLQERFESVTGSRILSDLEVIQDTAAEQRRRIAEIRTLRNYNYHFLVPEYVKIAANPREDKDVRLAMIEALGWFTHSYNKQYIIDTCSLITENQLEDDLIRREALKTLNRMNTL